MSVRIAIIGAGIMGADHARIVSEDLPGATLQVVCDASEARARAIAQACGAADISTDPLRTIRRADIDAVIIASPDETHASLSLAAIEAGKPVLCEKPLSQNAGECRAVIDAEVARDRRFVQLGFMRRFDPSYREMKAALAEGAIGRAIMMHNTHRNVEAPANFTGQMAITNSAPHEFDAARFMLDADYTAISVFQPAGVDASKTGAPVFMVLETDRGQIVNVEVNNNAAYGYDVRGELVGEKGSIQLTAPIHTRRNGHLMAFEHYPADWRPRFAEAYRLQNKAFLGFVRTGMFPAIAADSWDGYCATLVAEAGVAALRTGMRISLAKMDRSPLYTARQETLQ
ncbi:Gfo/Idh/MocA family oxidoreductase [Shinella sp. PSBB067]|uniref:Gfo/Idh/MocA family oxidoreductase n=1 Tax=Shinella sp. PSBB067 TaxID=2715959 RepID=UPI00193B335E|nr:Gfo/Idh/MocA family oxidoreductase [Shinella sp. PSBB067]QRI62433.1 Gfo/Idh/MocA family oxidoreductase [Shinella sp. PSBB067]